MKELQTIPVEAATQQLLLLLHSMYLLSELYTSLMLINTQIHETEGLHQSHQCSRSGTFPLFNSVTYGDGCGVLSESSSYRTRNRCVHSEICLDLGNGSN